MIPEIGKIVHYRIDGLKLAALICHYEGTSCNLVVWDSMGMPKMIHSVPFGMDDGHWSYPKDQSKLVMLS